MLAVELENQPGNQPGKRNGESNVAKNGDDLRAYGTRNEMGQRFNLTQFPPPSG